MVDGGVMDVSLSRSSRRVRACALCLDANAVSLMLFVVWWGANSQ